MMANLSDIGPIVIIEDGRDPDPATYIYEDPAQIITCASPDVLEEALKAIEEARALGLYAAGWLAYECGYLMEPRLRPCFDRLSASAGRPMPLLWFGLFTTRQRLKGREARHFWSALARTRQGTLGPLAPAVSEPDYNEAIARIKAYLAAGDVYQVNYTFPMMGTAQGDPLAIHAKIRHAHPVPFGAFIRGSDFCISSHSPELFIELRDGALTTKPMKGTARRGRTLTEDDLAAAQLAEDEKSRAENLMIVDLLRNDLSRLPGVADVSVDNLFAVERYGSVLQMTSTISARLAERPAFREVLGALFPCGSITGAPKIRAMEIIEELEGEPRGVYTGAIGHIAPNGDLTFNVPIRTLVIEPNGTARLPVGSGIVADSQTEAEYQECLLKASFVQAEPPPSLIETMRWSAEEGYWLLERHLDRLSRSARYFDYPVNISEIQALLDDEAHVLDPGAPWRVRLLVAPAGEVSITAQPLEGDNNQTTQSAPLPTIALAAAAVDSANPYLFHKTTHRAQYDEAFEKEARPGGHADVIFVNEKGEITEGSRHNLLIEVGGKLFTPPVSCGLLPGTCRESLLESTDSLTLEKILYYRDLIDADRIFLANSVRGLFEVRLAPTEIDS